MTYPYEPKQKGLSTFVRAVIEALLIAAVLAMPWALWFANWD